MNNLSHSRALFGIVVVFHILLLPGSQVLMVKMGSISFYEIFMMAVKHFKIMLLFSPYKRIHSGLFSAI